MSATVRKFSLEEYLAYNDLTDDRWKLVNGELAKMAIPSGRHGEIADCRNFQFRQGIERSDRHWVSKQMVIGIQSPRSDRIISPTFPDLELTAEEILH